ncbi:von willebrand factor A domain protein [Quillaja saponaria]|uniref:von willebrand factor A domain protein n=1 Tax=Quillaja saponaria TaxID=32244 RepID=A0AAD7Q4V0_QUISA|nr:von willebrand factor A domain protein [Quillaja saponaria]
MTTHPMDGSWFGKFDPAVNKNRDEEEEDGNRFLKLNFPSDHTIDLFDSESKSLDRTVVISQNMKVVVEVRVTVECVTETLCMDVRELGFTDIERTRNLDEEPCPGFISDGANRVQWVNGAFRRMVFGLKNLRQLPEMVVWLVMREKLVYVAFSCRVKLEYMWEKEKYSQVVPCDVWRMDCGGFAWRLDVKAALSLGR